MQFALSCTLALGSRLLGERSPSDAPEPLTVHREAYEYPRTTVLSKGQGYSRRYREASTKYARNRHDDVVMRHMWDKTAVVLQLDPDPPSSGPSSASSTQPSPTNPTVQHDAIHTPPEQQQENGGAGAADTREETAPAVETNVPPAGAHGAAASPTIHSPLPSFHTGVRPPPNLDGHPVRPITAPPAFPRPAAPSHPSALPNSRAFPFPPRAPPAPPPPPHSPAPDEDPSPAAARIAGYGSASGHSAILAWREGVTPPESGSPGGEPAQDLPPQTGGAAEASAEPEAGEQAQTIVSKGGDGRGCATVGVQTEVVPEVVPEGPPPGGRSEQEKSPLPADPLEEREERGTDDEPQTTHQTRATDGALAHSPEPEQTVPTSENAGEGENGPEDSTTDVRKGEEAPIILPAPTSPQNTSPPSDSGKDEADNSLAHSHEQKTTSTLLPSEQPTATTSSKPTTETDAQGASDAAEQGLTGQILLGEDADVHARDKSPPRASAASTSTSAEETVAVVGEDAELDKSPLHGDKSDDATSVTSTPPSPDVGEENTAEPAEAQQQGEAPPVQSDGAHAESSTPLLLVTGQESTAESASAQQHGGASTPAQLDGSHDAYSAPLSPAADRDTEPEQANEQQRSGATPPVQPPLDIKPPSEQPPPPLDPEQPREGPESAHEETADQQETSSPRPSDRGGKEDPPIETHSQVLSPPPSSQTNPDKHQRADSTPQSHPLPPSPLLSPPPPPPPPKPVHGTSERQTASPAPIRPREAATRTEAAAPDGASQTRTAPNVPYAHQPGLDANNTYRHPSWPLPYPTSRKASVAPPPPLPLGSPSTGAGSSSARRSSGASQRAGLGSGGEAGSDGAQEEIGAHATGASKLRGMFSTVSCVVRDAVVDVAAGVTKQMGDILHVESPEGETDEREHTPGGAAENTAEELIVPIAPEDSLSASGQGGVASSTIQSLAETTAPLIKHTSTEPPSSSPRTSGPATTTAPALSSTPDSELTRLPDVRSLLPMLLLELIGSAWCPKDILKDEYADEDE